MKQIIYSIILTLLFCAVIFAQEIKPLKILEKPTPQLTDAQKKTNIETQGTVTLRVEFLFNGQIGQVSVVSSLPQGLTENAVEAAKKIKFEPQIKDNKPINITKTIQYSFLHYWIEQKNQIENKKDNSKLDEKAEAILKKAVENVGGDKYLQAKSQIGRGRFAQMRDGAIISFQSFVDVIVFPDKERTEFKGAAKTVQVNAGKSGWIFDGDAETIKDQTAAQIEDYQRGTRVSLDNLLRGSWRGDGVLTYVGKRAGTLGKRNDVLKLAFPDEYAVEFEFADDGLPVKAIYKRGSGEEQTTEEDRYAQFVAVDGIKTPFIVDRFSNNVQSSRINYESIEFNKKISDEVFAKPKNAKIAKKDVRF